MIDVDALVAWLEAQIDEDERRSTAVVDHLMHGGAGAALEGVHISIRQHTMNWVPGRVAAEVEFKRSLIAEHRERRSVQSVRQLQRMAAVYRIRDGFDPSWLPEEAS